jgi:unsaturated chondroitin disaccharide hydrolase
VSTAQACADFYIQNTTAHGIPPNDWDEPSPVLPYESSAAAIAARGFLLLSKLIEPQSQASTYRTTSINILKTLCTPEFLAKDTPGWEGIVKHGIYHQRKGLGIDESLVWGDYYFLDTLYEVLYG